jgi:ABC-type transport system involved in multi-copper enzyme maturation permease subunit
VIPLVTPQRAAASVATEGWLVQTWRLMRWNLFTVRKRLMSKILLAIAVLGFALVIGFQLLAYDAITHAPTSAQGCATAAAQSGGSSVECGQISPEQQQQEQQRQQQFISDERARMTFPQSLGVAGSYISFMGVILLCILAGSLTGGEYGFGTVRLALSRGVGRAQMVVAQVAALAALALALAAAILVLGAISGFIVGPSLGATIPSIPGGGWLEIAEYWLAVSLNLFAFELVAFFIATLGRSTAAGIAASLGYVLLEGIVGGILVAISKNVPGDISAFLGHVPEWFLGINAAAVSTNAAQSPIDLGVSASSVLVQLETWRGLLVTLGYCMLLVGLSYLFVRQRDVTA